MSSVFPLINYPLPNDRRIQNAESGNQGSDLDVAGYTLTTGQGESRIIPYA